MDIKNYETVFILNPVLPEPQVKDAVEKYKKILTDGKAEIVNEENWGLKS
ncbi:MAG: 30S ribosomal protein S6, partial [Bacteroidota bacterium]|nr:30S ribosomal protein S6 [Bacteroidota bacterium]